MHRLDHEAIAACLRVWHEPLRALGSPVSFAEDQSPGTLSAPRTLWIECTEAPPLNSQSLEGLVALALLARVDAALWRTAITDIWTDASSITYDLRTWINFELTEMMTGRRAETFTLGLAINTRQPTDLRTLGATLVKLGKCSDNLRKAIQAMKISVSPTVEALGIPVSCRIDHSGTRSEDVGRTLQKIISTVIAGNKTKDIGFQFDIVDVRQCATEPDIKALALLVQLRALGVRIHDLPQLRPYCGSFKNASVLVPALQALLLENSHDSTMFRSTGVRNVTVSDVSPLRVVDAVLSAVAVSPSVRTVDVRDDKAPGEMNHEALVLYGEMWEMVARTLFSGHARHSVKHLHVGLQNFGERNRGAVDRVLQADNTGIYVSYHDRMNMEISATRFSLRHAEYGTQDGAKRNHSGKWLSRVLDRSPCKFGEKKTRQIRGRGGLWSCPGEVKPGLTRKTS